MALIDLYFCFGWRAFMSRVVLLVIDGCAPAYLTRQTAPKLYRLAEQYGFVKQVECAMPSVTNVNHACILSGK